MSTKPSFRRESIIEKARINKIIYEYLLANPIPGGSMVYPSGSGIPIVVSGTSWGTTITDNSTNWNTAYGWGNHATAGYVTGTPWTSMGYLTAETSHADVVVDGDFTSQGIMLRGASSGVYSILTDNSTNWNTAYTWVNTNGANAVTAYGWGDHAGLYRPITYVPAHGALTGLGDDDHTQYYNQTRGDARYSLSGHTHAESTITFTDITTGNATTLLHGYLPKLGGGTTNFLRADGTWAAPAGGSGLTQQQIEGLI